MKINILAIGTRMPAWVTQGCQTYLDRMPADYQTRFIEIPAMKRETESDLNKILIKEGELLINRCTAGHLTIALDRLGKSITTIELANMLTDWHDLSQNIDLLIGGPEGIHPDTLKKAQLTWSLSQLTLPHPMVRILIAEQIYRAYTIIKGHPYHR